MANVKITDLTAYTDAASTDVLPVVDVSNNVTKKISIADLLKAAPLGSAAAPGIAFDGDPNTGVYSPGADQVAISTNGAGRLFVGSAGDVGIGGAPSGSYKLEVKAGAIDSAAIFDSTNAVGPHVRFSTSGTDRHYLGSAPGFTAGGTSSDFAIRTAGYLALLTGGNNERLRITSAGLVGIGTSSPNSILHISGSSDQAVTIQTTTAGADTRINFRNSAGTDAGGIQYMHNGNHLLFNTNAGERARIDGSGRLLLSTSSSASQGCILQVRSDIGLNAEFFRSADNSGGPYIALTKTRGTAASPTEVSSGDDLGIIDFIGYDGATYRSAATIQAQADGTWTDGGDTTDNPGRLVFSTTADGASSPTERMRIDNAGRIGIGKTPNVTESSNGFEVGSINSAGTYCMIGRASGTVLYVNRNTDDGTIVSFLQDGNAEGSISVSGTTVSYNGAHLSRWSQLSSGAERIEILRGTVLSNIDEMCEWGEEDNEQLNRMKVSDVEGDKNVSGVFQAWDDDDDTYTNDFYCAMTGDFIIRIAAGVTVERGDLLMSAGDGTAKPQDDDIIRSKTIAKVTSTNVSCTYDDGSYCVPCVLMAC